MSHILVVDDNQLICELLEESLTEAGYTVSTAATADAGYQKALAAVPDLMLLDVALPDVTGFELLRMIKSKPQLQSIPVIMITGSHHQLEHKVKGFQTGADDYLLKPFEMPELLERIRALLRRSAPQGAAAPAVPSALIQPFPRDPVIPAPAALSLRRAIAIALLNPTQLSDSNALPPIALPYLMVFSALLAGGLALGAGETVKPAVAGVVFGGAWIVLTCAFAISCSVLGVVCDWKESTRTLALAGLPLLLKMAGAVAFTAWTTLPPFHFTAGLPLFWTNAPSWAFRVDVFEVWSFLLLWLLLRKKKGASLQRACAVTLIVWGLFNALALGMHRIGTGG